MDTADEPPAAPKEQEKLTPKEKREKKAWIKALHLARYQTCGHCLFFVQESAGELDEFETWGHCYRYPPVLNREVAHETSQRPAVDAHGFCGEWKDVKKAKPGAHT